MTFWLKIDIISICVVFICEVIDINKRKYLAELGKLLTFMYEEDRLEALALYEQLFDDAEDETALIEFLGSPTRQAVVVAHAYNAKERKLAVTSQEGAEFADVSGDETPPFVEAINGLRRKAEELGIVMPDRYTVPEDLFVEEEAAPAEESLPEDTAAADAKEETLAEETQEPAEETGDATAEISEEAAEPVSPPVSPEEELQALFAHPQEEETPEEAQAPAEEEAEELPPENIMLDLGPIPEPERSDPDQINEVMAAFREKDEEEIPEDSSAEQTSLSEFEEPAPSLEEATPWKQIPPEEASGKANILAVIIYLIAAVPITAAGVLILLLPTLLFFSLSAGSGVLAFYTASSAFGNFAVFADIMVVLGAALVFASLALFFFFVFLWFIVGAIAGLINAAIRLGGKICFKEGKQA